MSDSYCDVDFGDASDDADPVQFYDESQVKRSRKAHVCDECGGAIALGEPYWRKSYRFDGTFACERICCACREVAGEFDFRLVGGLLWEFFAEQWNEGARLQSCLNRLTSVRAKQTMTAQWQKWHARRDEVERQRKERLRQLREKTIASKSKADDSR